MKLKQFLSGILALLFVVSLPVSALAADWDISAGDITVNAESGGQTVTQGGEPAVEDPSPVIKGSSTENTVTINAEKDQTAKVTLSGANIDVSSEGKAAVSTTGGGSVSIELDGENTLRGGDYHAGLEKKNGGSLTIADENKNGKLTAEGGKYGAGIGGGNKGNGNNIAITGGEVEATGGYGGAGIGGGNDGGSSGITISGDAKVNAQGGDQSGAGIGGGKNGAGSGITISGGEVKATGGDFGAGIGGGENGDGSGITISGDAKVNATGGKRSAGIGGGDEGSGRDIEITGGKVTASSKSDGAGIGGGDSGDGENITISGGEVTATGGSDEEGLGSGYGAGIGGGHTGDGRNIKITGGKVTASSKNAGAGIGGGDEGNGEDITITGGEVKASSENVGAGIGGGYKGDGKRIKITGGTVDAASDKGAGIGGGDDGDGENIAISGGKVTAKSSKNGAGIGGGLQGKGKDITISGDAQLKVQGGVGDFFNGPGAGIGDGGSRPKGSTGGSPIPGAEVEPDTSGLTTGRIEYYAPGANMEKDKPTSTTFGTSLQPEKPIEPGAECGMDAPLYRVTDKDGRNVAYTAEQKDGVLTVTVDADFAILTGSLSNIRTLKAQGVEKIVFVTKGAASAFALADLLESGSTGKTYQLTHDGKTVTFTLGEDMADVSAILTQP